MATRDEILRFVAQVDGQDAVKKMGDSFDTLGKAADNADPKARELIDQLDRLATTEKAVNGFAAIKAKLQETGDSLFIARQRVKELETEFNNTLEPTKKLTKELDKARGEVARLATEEQRQTAALQRAQNVIKGAGYDLNNLAKAQADVTARTSQAVNEARDYAAALQKTGTQAKQTGGILQSLRGAVAGLFAGLSIRGAAEGVKDIAALGDQAEKTQQQLSRMFGSTEAGAAAYAAIKKFADDNAQALDQTTASAVKLKAFGIDPLKGSLQALTDENAAMGGSQERLEGTILAVGQAWAKQKLQGEEILQLVERGVPVWDLLAKVTGKSVAEVQKLSEAGKLGRKEIAGLIEEIGRLNKGAAAQGANTLSGQFTQLTGRVREFFTTVANSGTLDYLKGQLAALNQRIKDMAASGQLAALAKSISDGIVATGQAIAGVVGFVKDYGEQILTLARAYAVFKGASFLASFAKSSMSFFDGMTKSAAGATGAVGKFRAAAANIGQGVQFAALTVAVDFTVNRLTALVDVTKEYMAVQANLKQRQQELVQIQTDLGARARQTAQLYADAGKVQLATTEELATKSRAQLQEYIRQIENAYRLNIALRDQARQKGDAEGLNNLVAAGRDLVVTLDAAKVRFEALGGEISNATGEFARNVAKNFDLAIQSGRDAASALAGVFDKLDLTTPAGVKDLVETLAVVGPRAREARAAIEGELGAALNKLNGEQLRTFQQNSKEAFEAAKTGAKDAALIMDEALSAALTRLGVNAAQAGVAFTTAGRDIIATFKAVLENAQATGDQIAAAFDQALKKITTKEEAEALGQAIKRAGETGKLGIDQAKDAAAALALRLREIANAANPLADEFERLGITSKAQLDATRDAAARAFDTIVAGARRGQAAQEDVRAAFLAYVDAARAAAANSSAAAQAQVEAQLQAKAAALGLKDALDSVGAAGAKAGDNVAAGASKAAAALDDTADSADQAADSAGKLGQQSNNAAQGLQNVADAGQQAASIGLDVSKAFADASTSLDGLDRIAFNVLEGQQRQAAEYLATLQQQLGAYDEMTQKVNQLRDTYTALSDAQLQQIARTELQLDQARKREQEEKQRAREQQRQSSSSSGSGGSSGGISRTGPVELIVTVKNGMSFAEALREPAVARDAARHLIPALRDLIRSGMSLEPR